MFDFVCGSIGRQVAIVAILAAAGGSAHGAAPVVEKDTSAFGFKLHYREAGSGPVVILLHGLGGDGSRWTSTMDVLSGQFRVIALDQIGFGQSDKPLVNYNHGLLTEFLIEFMRALEIPEASIVGHSMGAFVGTYAGVHYPEMVDRLVLVDGGSLTTRPRSAHLGRIQNSTTLAETREYFELLFYDKSRVTDQLVRDNYARRLRAAYTISRMQESRANKIGMIGEAEAARIKAPTLILWGQQDTLLPVEDVEQLDRIIPDSQSIVLDKCGHMPQVEQPAQFNELVLKFLTEKRSNGDDRQSR
jgi:pimeloyl-ACP methyl ester carboxylesterase